MREQLIQAIEDDPDDVESYRVFSDWLESNGQPRRHLIAMELLLARLDVRDNDRLSRQGIAAPRKVAEQVIARENA